MSSFESHCVTIQNLPREVRTTSSAPEILPTPECCQNLRCVPGGGVHFQIGMPDQKQKLQNQGYQNSRPQPSAPGCRDVAAAGFDYGWTRPWLVTRDDRAAPDDRRKSGPGNLQTQPVVRRLVAVYFRQGDGRWKSAAGCWKSATEQFRGNSMLWKPGAMFGWRAA